MTWLRQRTPEAAIAKHSGAKRFAYRVGREGCVRSHTCELSRAMEKVLRAHGALAVCVCVCVFFHDVI